MKKVRLTYLIFGTFLLLYLFLYNPKQSLTNFQSYISNFNPEKTIVGRFILKPINQFIVTPRFEYYCGGMEVISIAFEPCKSKALNQSLYKKIRKKKDYNEYYTIEEKYVLFEGGIMYPYKKDLNAERRISFEKFETYILLILAFSILWRHRFKATEALRDIYKKI